MRQLDNIRAISKVGPDWMGFIFYSKSKRSACDLDPDQLNAYLDKNVKRVGVFVNATMAEITKRAKVFALDFIQLHGDETVDFVQTLSDQGLRVIKVFRVSKSLPVEEIRAFEPFVNFFLFDTQTPNYGGSGQKFDWQILKEYDSDVPFLLSGGLQLEDIEDIQHLKHSKLAGIDINSRFETSPGLKDINKVKALKELL